MPSNSGCLQATGYRYLVCNIDLPLRKECTNIIRHFNEFDIFLLNNRSRNFLRTFAEELILVHPGLLMARSRCLCLCFKSSTSRGKNESERRKTHSVFPVSGAISTDGRGFVRLLIIFSAHY